MPDQELSGSSTCHAPECVAPARHGRVGLSDGGPAGVSEAALEIPRCEPTEVGSVSVAPVCVAERPSEIDVIREREMSRVGYRDVELGRLRRDPVKRAHELPRVREMLEHVVAEDRVEFAFEIVDSVLGTPDDHRVIHTASHRAGGRIELDPNELVAASFSQKLMSCSRAAADVEDSAQWLAELADELGANHREVREVVGHLVTVAIALADGSLPGGLGIRRPAYSSCVTRPKVVLLRGYHANPWELRAWTLLEDRFDVTVLVPGRNAFESDGLGVPSTRVHAFRDRLPASRASNAVAYALGDRYADLRAHLANADVVHAAEIGTWFSAQAASAKAELGFRLALTVWETIPFLDTYRWPRERRYRRAVMPAVDRYLAATERARDALLLEGVDPALVTVCQPGIDVDHFAREPHPENLVVSPGRLVWEKGHQDVLRAVAALAKGLVGTGDAVAAVRLLIVGAGPEAKKLERYARELGIHSRVEFRHSVPYDEMPAVYARAACVVLGSLPTPGWEEQFGMVLAEAMASGAPIVTTTSGAIPEVVAREARVVAPGDWMPMAREIAGVLEYQARNGARSPTSRALVPHYSNESAAERIAAEYERLLARS